METRCFRLNILTGDTDLIDDDTSRLLRECGVKDGINSIRYALSGEPVHEYDCEHEYIADESDMSTDDELSRDKVEDTSASWSEDIDDGMSRLEDEVPVEGTSVRYHEEWGSTINEHEHDGGEGEMKDPVMGNDNDAKSGEREHFW